MERLALQHRPTFSANYLLPALNAGLVEMTQPESPKSPTQKYLSQQRITDALSSRVFHHPIVFWHDADGEFSFIR
jgi:hypothetical protein